MLPEPYVAYFAGLSRLDSVHLYNMQADLGNMVVNIVPTMIIANLISNAKKSLANAFAPNFALALA